jgi:hypothetical protein
MWFGASIILWGMGAWNHIRGEQNTLRLAPKKKPVVISDDTAKRADHGVVGGHAEMLRFEGDKLIKTAPVEEAIMYRLANDLSLVNDPDFTAAQRAQVQKMGKWFPKFYEAKNLGETAMLGEKNKSRVQNMSEITMENARYGREDGNYMDIKIGTSTVTKWAATKGQKYLDARNQKDIKRETNIFGFVITGYCCGKHRYGVHDKTPELEREDHLCRLFCLKEKFQLNSARWLREQLAEMIEFFDNENTFELRGVSLFVVMDHVKKYNNRAVLIDLTSYEDTGAKDEGFVFGLRKLSSMIGDLIGSSAQDIGAMELPYVPEV